MHSCLPGNATVWRQECNLSTFLPPVTVQQQSFANARQRPYEKAPKHNLLQPIWWQGKKILPTVPEEINLVFTEACRMHSCALTCQWKPVISQQELGLMRQYHTYFASWDRKKNWWSNWVISDMSYQLSGETQIPSFTEAKLYSLLAYVTCILEMEYFCFKELTCGQTHWHQAVSSPLKQYRAAEAHTIFFFSTLAMFPILHYYEQQR